MPIRTGTQSSLLRCLFFCVQKKQNRYSGKNTKFYVNNFLDEVTQKLESNIDALKGEIEKRADDDAKELVSRYFKALSKGFERYAGEELKNFRNGFESYLDRFTESAKK